MLLATLELSSVLQIVLSKVIDSTAFNPFPIPGTIIPVSVWKHILLLLPHSSQTNSALSLLHLPWIFDLLYYVESIAFYSWTCSL